MIRRLKLINKTDKEYFEEYTKKDLMKKDGVSSEKTSKSDDRKRDSKGRFA